MSRQAYDDKNDADYEQYTELLQKGIAQIKNDRTLKPTIAQLANLTGIHRNTISKREWPIQHLKAIKTIRKEQAANKANEKSDGVAEDPIKVLQVKLDNAQLELIYWFNLHADMENAFNQSDKRFRRMRDARDDYKARWEEERRMRLDAETESERLMELINTLDMGNLK